MPVRPLGGALNIRSVRTQSRPVESHRRQLSSMSICTCDIFPVLINSLCFGVDSVVPLCVVSVHCRAG